MPITTTSFTSVNVGTSANDGTGDELRIAFQKVNSNFSNISTVGFNSGNILVSGNVQAVYFVGDGSQLTNISSSNAYGNANVAAYLVAYNGIVTATNVSVAGNVTAQWLVGQANLSSILTTDLGASGMIYANAGINSTSTGTGALVVNGGAGITGNLTVGNITVLGTLTTINSTALSVANSFVFLGVNNSSNALDLGFVGQYNVGQGNVYTGLAYRAADGIYRLFSNLNPRPSTTINTANVTPASLQLGNILAANIIGTIITPAQEYITSIGNLANIRSSGNITTTGYFFGNGSQLAGIVSYSNVFVATYLPTYSGNVANLTVTATLAGPTITAINSNVTVSNTNMKNYVDGQITAANSAVTAANLGLKGYVDNSVSTANIGMKGYVDSVASQSIYGNSNVKSYLTQFDGNIIPNANAVYSLGSVTNQWKELFVSNSTVYIGGYPITCDTGGNILFNGEQIVTFVTSSAGNLGVGQSAGIYSQGDRATAVGANAGASNQGGLAVAVGAGSGYLNQGANAVAIGSSVGYENQGNAAIGIGRSAGGLNQGEYAVAIGYYGNNIVNGTQENQGAYSISLGYKAGLTSQPSKSIIVNANDVPLNATANIAGLYISPVRNDTSNITNAVYYNTTTKEITYGPSSVAYSNVNVKAYTETMGFSNYSNVNVSALITTNGLTNYSNVNVIAYLAGNITVGNIAGSVNGFSIGYRDVPQITVANLTLIASDAGKHYYGANTNPTTITIPTNANVAFGNGTAISIVNQGTGNITVANAAGVALYLAGNSTAGSRVITSYGMATLIKVQVNTWFINGTGVS